MQYIQKFSDEQNVLVPSAEFAIKAIEKLPLPYTGNKKKLLHQIYNAIYQENLNFNSVLDAFSGTASVAFLFKLMGKKVIANDLLTSSYFNAVAFVENPGIKLSTEEKQFLLKNENKNKSTFVEDNYLGFDPNLPDRKSRYNKFTLKECQFLDNFRANVDELCNKYAQSLSMAANAAVVMRLPFGNLDQTTNIMHHRVKQSAEYGNGSQKKDRRIGIYYDNDNNLNFEKWFDKYVSDFVKFGHTEVSADESARVKRAASFANVQQHVLRDCFVGGRMHNGQVLAEVSVRLQHQKNQLKRHYSNGWSSEMNFLTQNNNDLRKPGEGLKWWTFSDLELTGQCLATNMDVLELLKSSISDVDCVYFDPPYGGQSSDYAYMYRFLEEYIYSQSLEELPHIQQYAKRFVKKTEYEIHFREMLTAAKKIPIWIFSYNDSSWKNVDYITAIIKEFKNNVKLIVLSDHYRYLYRKKQGRKNQSTEYLITAQ